MKTSRGRSDNVVDMPRVDRAGTASAAPRASEDQVAQRAFELYCARGCEDGHDVEDWLQAERDLRGSAESRGA
jgi:hypothetical protein